MSEYRKMLAQMQSGGGSPPTEQDAAPAPAQNRVRTRNPNPAKPDSGGVPSGKAS